MVAFDAVGPSSSGAGNLASTTLSWTHTCVASGTTVLAGVSLDVASGDSGLTLSVTLGGVAMSSFAKVETGSGAGGGYLQVFRAEGVASGAHAIAVTCSGGTPLDLEGGSVSFTGGGALGTVFTASGASGNPSVAATGTISGNMVAAFTACGNTIASSSNTSRFIINEQASNGQDTGNAAGSTAASTGGTVTMAWTITSSAWAAWAVEVQPPGGVTYVPQRYGQAAAPSPAPWEQRPYRSVPGAADTPANPLVTPLDTAWQADAWYSHLYADSHLRDRRQYFYQRPLVSDPNLFLPAADPLALNPEQSPSSDMWRIAAVPAFCDRRLVPQQRTYYDVTLLATAQLENELLGGAETPKYYRQPATHADRREYPYQPKRDAYTPGLLDRALLENELLGGAGTAQRYGFAAYYDRREVPQQPARLADPLLIGTAELENELLGGADVMRHYLIAAYWDRRLVPQQRAYVSDPLLLLSAQLENELLGGAETWLHYITSAWIDRREIPQQRPYVSDPSFYPAPNPLDPLLAGQDWLDGHQHQAATHYDRREVPQQRAYISDPSFYPTGAVTDPLTVAWGAGGPYWHLYNRAADITDRREYFTQRPYQSDPLLLLSAQLENELLGGAQTGTYYRVPATHYARWWMPQQPARLADPLLIATAELEGNLLGAADTARYWLAACYADRREVPQQRAYVSDPLLLTTAELENELLGGAGTAMRYLQPATHADRREVPAQPPRLALQLPLVPLDPTQSAWAALWLAYNLAATHQDRRLYPQQRLYWPVPLPGPSFTIGTLTGTDAALAVLASTAAAGAASAGTLTGTDAALAVLASTAAAGAASAGTLTGTDQRTGGPG